MPDGTPVKYWGHASQNKHYGKEFTVLYANKCSCAHQTYALALEGKEILGKVLRSSFTIVES